MFSVNGTSPYDGKKEIKDINWGNGCIEVMQLCNIVSLKDEILFSTLSGK